MANESARNADRRERRSGRLLAALCIVLAAVVVAACGASELKTIPNIKGMSLDFAKARLESAGLEYAYDEDQGAFGILDESNWKVCASDPPIGTTTSKKVWLIVRHYNC